MFVYNLVIQDQIKQYRANILGIVHVTGSQPCKSENKSLFQTRSIQWSNPTKWTHLGAVSATVGVTLLDI